MIFSCSAFRVFWFWNLRRADIFVEGFPCLEVRNGPSRLFINVHCVCSPLSYWKSFPLPSNLYSEVNAKKMEVFNSVHLNTGKWVTHGQISGEDGAVLGKINPSYILNSKRGDGWVIELGLTHSSGLELCNIFALPPTSATEVTYPTEQWAMPDQKPSTRQEFRTDLKYKTTATPFQKLTKVISWIVLYRMF